MRILHFYPKTDAVISQYFDMLASNMGLEVENHQASTSEEARQLLRTIDFDILHVHGCWNNAQFMIVRKALQQGARLVVTPYGQLEPWVQQQRFWKEKLPKRIAYQKSVVEQAYAVIVQGVPVFTQTLVPPPLERAEANCNLLVALLHEDPSPVPFSLT